MTLIECVPNFSEGRRTDVIAHLADVIASVEGVLLLSSSSDPDHNRTVITFAGSPAPVAEAAFRAVQAAAVRINLDMHQGVHPRIGAADVVPFVPLRDASMLMCVEIAQQLAQRVAAELNLPVYLYEHAAQRPERRHLSEVRRDPYEILKDTIRYDPSRTPDFGPSALGTAGAVAIGARAPLIAFNAYLDTTDVKVAKHIARHLRESGGGLPFVKALGLLVNGQAQVSMNITDYRQTSLLLVMEHLRRLAAQQHTAITHTELVGLVPGSALIDTALMALQLPAEVRNRVLENRIGTQTGDYREIRFE